MHIAVEDGLIQSPGLVGSDFHRSETEAQQLANIITNRFTANGSPINGHQFALACRIQLQEEIAALCIAVAERLREPCQRREIRFSILPELKEAFNSSRRVHPAYDGMVLMLLELGNPGSNLRQIPSYAT